MQSPHPKEKSGATDSRRKWFIMTSPDPKLVEVRLLEENIRREESGLPTFQYFIPYQFLCRRMAASGPDIGSEGESTGYYNPLGRGEVSADNQLRSALKRYIFIRSSDGDMDLLLGDSGSACRTLWFYRDRGKNRLTVSDEAMGRFIDACCDRRILFEVWPSPEHIPGGAEVVLNATPFRGCRARVLEVRHDRRGISLTVGLHVLRGALYLRLPSLRAEDVLYEPEDADPVVREHNRYKLVEDTQRQIFGVMSRRSGGGRPSAKSRMKDAALLESLYNYRYRTFSGDAMRRRFTGLMLLCASLLGDRYGVDELAGRARSELASIESRPKSKMSVSVRAFLLSALYIATGEEPYYREAMDYFNAQTKLTEVQKQLVGFMAERHGGNVNGGTA